MLHEALHWLHSIPSSFQREDDTVGTPKATLTDVLAIVGYHGSVGFLNEITATDRIQCCHDVLQWLHQEHLTLPLQKDLHD